MRTIIAGSRGITSPTLLRMAIDDLDWEITTVLSGCARGVDRLGEQWAEAHGIPVERFPADWAQYGRSAGYVRNAVMANRADALLALWDGESRGTKNMISIANNLRLLVTVVTYPKLPPRTPLKRTERG